MTRSRPACAEAELLGCGQEMNPTPFPTTALQSDLYGGFETLVNIRNDPVNPMEGRTVNEVRNSFQNASVSV